MWTFRGAPHLVRRADLPALTRRLHPLSDADAAARLGSRTTRSLREAGIGALAAFAEGARALREVVTAELPRGRVSAEMTARLPPAYSYECRACASTHVFGDLFQLVGLAAGVEVRAESRPTLLRPLPDRHPLPGAAEDPSALALAYLRLHGPATPAEVAGFLGTSTTQARRLWPDGLAEVDVDGRRAFLPEEDLPALRRAPEPDPVRLLPPLDPLLQGRDRDLLVPDERRRAQLWRIIGNPGAVLAGGEVVGAWRPKAGKRRLDVTVTAFEPLSPATRAALEAESHRVAAARGLAEARLVLT